MSDESTNPTTGAAEPNAGSDVSDETTKLVVEFTVSPADFVLSETLAAVPEMTVEFEQFVPTSPDLLPYLWVTDAEVDEFERAATNDPTVETLRRLARFDDGALYQVSWADSADRLLTWLRERDATILQAETRSNRWYVKLRVDSRDSLRDLQRYCDDRDVQFQLVRLYDLTEPKMGQFDVSEKQRELLILALQMGFFDVPRSATLEDVADRIGISSKAASERLRRGQTNLVRSTLTIGEPTGVGVDGER